MRKTRKLQVAASVLGFTAAVAGLALINAPAQVKADETATFAMAEGAAVRAVANEAGIRWETTVNKAWYDANIPSDATNVEFGTIVTAAKNVTAIKNLNVGTTDAEKLACSVTPDFATDTTFTYYSSIVYNNMSDWTDAEKKLAYATELIARSYVKYAVGEETTWLYADANDTARCMRAVALAAYEETDEDKALTTEQKEVVDDYFATAGTAIDFEGYYETANTAADTIDAAYEVAYAGAKKVGTLAEGVLTLDEDALGEKYALTLFDANGNYVKTSEFQYVTKAVTNNSFTTDLTTETETGKGIRNVYYVLTENITLSDAWSNTVGFYNSILDGNGHTISGLTLAAKQGLFGLVSNSTVKNVAVKNVVMNGYGATFAYGDSDNATFDNVYVSLAPQLFANANATDYNTVTANSRKAAFLFKTATDGVTTLKNCVAYMPEHLATDTAGLVAACADGGTVVVENSKLIGGNGLIVGNNSKYLPDAITVDGAAVTHGEDNGTDAVTAYQAISAKAEADRTFAENAFLANIEYVELTAANFVAQWATLNTSSMFGGTFEIVALTEALDFAAKEGETGYVTNGASFAAASAEVRFFGVFDGQGHTISNVTRDLTGSYQAVFFNGLYGSFKNVALMNFAVTGTANCGIISCQASGNSSYLENVVIEATKLSSTEYAAALFGSMKSHTFSMKDVVVYYRGTENANADAALFGNLNKADKTLIFENCHFVNEWSTTAKWYGVLNTSNTANTNSFNDGCGLTSYTAISQVNTNNLTALAKGVLGKAG